MSFSVYHRHWFRQAKRGARGRRAAPRNRAARKAAPRTNANGAAPADFYADEEKEEEALAWKHVVLVTPGPVYFERQLLRHCFKNAINNVLGAQVLTVDDLDAAACALEARSRQRARGTGESVKARWHDEKEGNYSTKAVQNALVKKGYDLRRFREAERDPSILPQQTAGKFVVRVLYGARDTAGQWASHMIAIDCDRCLLLDSQAATYLPLTSRNFRAKTGPNARYPQTHIDRVYRVVDTRPRPSARSRPRTQSDFPAAS